MPLENGADGLAQCRVPTKLQFVKNAISAKCIKAKWDEMTYAWFDLRVGSFMSSVVVIILY